MSRQCRNDVIKCHNAIVSNLKFKSLEVSKAFQIQCIIVTLCLSLGSALGTSVLLRTVVSHSNMLQLL